MAINNNRFQFEPNFKPCLKHVTMFYFIVTFIALTTIKQWIPLFSPQPAIHHLNDSCLSPFTSPCHSYRNMEPCSICDFLPNLDQTFDISLGSNLHPHHVASGHKTHNPGCMTQKEYYALSIQCHLWLKPGYIFIISNKWHRDVINSYGMMNNLLCWSSQSHSINPIIMPEESEKTKNQCSKSNLNIYLLQHKLQLLHSKSPSGKT